MQCKHPLTLGPSRPVQMLDEVLAGIPVACAVT